MTREDAEKRVEEIKGYYTHLAIFIGVNIFLFVIDVTTGDGWWFFYPLFGWGIGMLAHTFSLFGFTKEWEEKKIRELTDKK